MDLKGKDLQRKTLGRQGEEIAVSMLEGMGYEIISCNWHSGSKEIDIICRDGADLRFVEVKTRKLPMEGEPWEAVDRRKQMNIGRAARAFLASERCRGVGVKINECHFDVVTVVWDEDGENCTKEYIPDAFFLLYV